MADSVYIGWFGPTQGSSSGSGGPVFPTPVSATRFFAGDGSASAPSYSFASWPTAGWYATAADVMRLSLSGSNLYTFSSSALTMHQDLGLNIGDVSLSRGAANRLDLASGDSLYLVSGGLGVGTPSTSSGQIVTTDRITGGEGFVSSNNGGFFRVSDRAEIASPGTLQLNFRNTGNTLGVGLEFTTDSVLAIRNRAQTASGAIALNSVAAATSTYKLVKKVTGIADNTATDVLTVTIPNANHAATIKITLLSSNGSTDAFESSRTAEGAVVVARTTGANAVAAVATLTLAQIATVAAGATHTLAYGVSAIAGAVGATNTFTVQVTIDDSGNLGSNQCVVLAELVNAEATGITIA